MHNAIGLTQRNKNFRFIDWLSNLHAQLETMSKEQNILFLVDCCRRLYGNYEKFSDEANWGDPALVRTGIQLLQDSTTSNADASRVTSLITKLMKVAPDTEDFTSDYTSAALDAVVALIHSLEYCVDGNVDHGVQVACRCRDTAYMFVSQRDQVGYTIDTDEDEARIYNDPLIEQELLAQQQAMAIARQRDSSTGK